MDVEKKSSTQLVLVSYVFVVVIFVITLLGVNDGGVVVASTSFFHFLCYIFLEKHATDFSVVVTSPDIHLGTTVL